MLPASHLSWQFRMQLGGCDVRLAKWRKASPPVALPSPMRQSLAVRSLPSLLRFLPTRLRPDSKNYSPTQLSACLLVTVHIRLRTNLCTAMEFASAFQGQSDSAARFCQVS
jgi:hypothetical protein